MAPSSRVRPFLDGSVGWDGLNTGLLETGSMALALVLLAGCTPSRAPAGAGADASSPHEFDSGGTPISYTVKGAGEPVILVHGYTVDSHGNWGAPGVIGALAEDFRVIAMDVRGHGASGKPHAPEAYGRELLHDLVRLMDHLSLEEVHLVGYSLGAEARRQEEG